MSSVTNPVLNEGLQDVINLLQGIGTDLNETVGLSVIGVAGTATAPVDAITAPGNGYLLGTDGDELVFTQLTGSMIPNDIISNGMLRNSSALSVIGRSANSTGDPGDIAGTANQVLRVSSDGTTLGFGTISLTSAVTGTLPVGSGGTGATTLTGLLQGNGTSAVTTITNSTTVGQVLRVTGSNTYGWGALDLADADAITGDLPDANLSANVPLLNANNTFTGANLTVSNDSNPAIRITDTTTPTTVVMQAGNSSTFIGTTTNHPLELFTNNATRMTIAADGAIALTTANITGPFTVTANLEGTTSLAMNNANTGNASARLVLGSGDASSSLFTAGSGRTSTIVTNGPTGAQTVLRNLGAYPIIFGTDNQARARISQQIDLADDATGTFPIGGYGLCIVTSTWSRAVTCMFFSDGVNCLSVFTGSGAALGTAGSNPDTDGFMNVWKSASGTLSIKNRLGDSRSFTVTTLGEFS